MKLFNKNHCSGLEGTLIALAVLSGLAGLIYFLKKKTGTAKVLKPAKNLDIEIRYDTEKDADAVMLAQNQVKIIRMVLTPLEKRIHLEKATLIYVFGGDFWEMRLKNASDQLKGSIRQLLEAKEW